MKRILVTSLTFIAAITAHMAGVDTPVPLVTHPLQPWLQPEVVAVTVSVGSRIAVPFRA